MTATLAALLPGQAGVGAVAVPASGAVPLVVPGAGPGPVTVATDWATVAATDWATVTADGATVAADGDAVAAPLQAAGGLPRDWAFVLGNADYLLGGTVLTVALTVASVLLGFAVGFPAGAAETYGGPRTRGAVEAVGTVLRGTPLLVILTFVYFGTPFGRLIAAWLPAVNGAFVAAVLGLGLRSAAYQSQVFRGAFESVAGGQMEAARAVGLSRVGAIRHVVVPQALRRSVPGFQNEVTIVLKDTSIAFAIGISELLTRSFDLFTQSGRTTAIAEVILTASGIYFLLTLTANRSLDYVRARYRVPTGEG